MSDLQVRRQLLMLGVGKLAREFIVQVANQRRVEQPREDRIAVAGEILDERHD